MTRRAVQCGTHSGYNTHRHRGETPCDPCRAANTAYHREHYRRNRARLVPADNARARIAYLEQQGFTLLAIAEAADLGAPHLRRIARGQTRSLTRAVEARILDADPDPRPADDPRRMVPAAGTARRIAALRAMGWTLDHLAGRLGVKLQQLHAIETRRKRVTTRTAAAVEALYDELAMRPGPSQRLRIRARNAGAVTPLGWSEDIDDPAALADMGGDGDDAPDPVVVDRLIAGAMPWRDAAYVDRLEAARRVIGRPGGPKFCEVGLGLNSSTIARIRQEAAA